MSRILIKNVQIVNEGKITVSDVLIGDQRILKIGQGIDNKYNAREINGENKYLTDPASMRKDISLIFENAMKFNLPKHKVHKEASRLGEVCSAVLDTIWSRLEQNAART
jgi:alpha-D-ribose 1-methylphosphonate 5-triphosphate diphosphatase PhnM